MPRTWFAAFVAMICVASAFSAEPAATPSRIVSHIPRERIESSAIAKVGYSKRRHILEVEFLNGAVYRYLDVPPSVYRDLMSAQSKARFYDFNVKGHYRSVVIRPQQKSKIHN
jgi:KTSC domain